MIRYRCSFTSKRCRLSWRAGRLRAGNREIDKCSGSGDSMLARVKIKEIDGVTLQGVDCAA